MLSKHLHKCVGYVVHSLIMTLLFLWGGGVTASAEGSGTKDDPYVLEIGETYDAIAYKSFYGKFTAPSDGILYLPYNKGLSSYTDDSYSTAATTQPQDLGTFNYSTLECTEGTTYYIASTFVWNGGSFEIIFRTEALPLELTECTPEQNTELDAAKAKISLTFNQEVSISGCTMTSGTNSANLTVNGITAYWGVEASAKLVEWYQAGTLNEDDEVKFTFTGITASADNSIVYGTDGTLELTYTVGAEPMMLTSTTNTPESDTPVTDFKSYYMSGDNTGIITLTFSKDLNSTLPEVYLEIGDRETSPYKETLTPTRLGNNMLFINLKNKVRTYENMNISSDYKTITLTVRNVKDADGNSAYSPLQGNVGSFSFTYNFKEVNYNPTSMWSVDGNESSLSISSDSKNIEYWIREADTSPFSFTGVEINYTADGAAQTKTLANSELTIDESEPGERTITIPVPNITIDANTEVNVKFTGVERPDGGTDLSLYETTITSTGRTESSFEITSAVWHSGDGDKEMKDASIDVLASGTTSTINVNKLEEVGYVQVDCLGPSDAPDEGYVCSMRGGTISADGIEVEWFGESLYAGYDYTLTLKAWKSEQDMQNNMDPTVGVATFTIHGAKQQYVYSDVVLNTDISNDYVLASADENTFELEFSGDVNIKEASILNGMGMDNIPCTAVKTGDDASKWTITIPASVLGDRDQFTLNVFAEDSEGKAVNKTANGQGSVYEGGDNTWFQINFVTEFNRPEFTISPEDGSTLTEISRIVFSYDTGIYPNYAVAGTAGNITIYNKGTRETVAELTMNDVQPGSTDTEFYVEIAEAITEPGSYDVIIPSSYFLLGEDQMASASKQQTVTYVIKGESKPLNYTVSPAAGNVQSIPETLVLTFPDEDYADVDWNYTSGASLTDADGNAYALDFAAGTGYNQINVTLKDGAITAAGTYTLSFPAGMFIFGEWGDTSSESPVEFTYVIGTTGIDSLVAAEGGSVDVYNVNGVLVLRNADAAAVKALAKGLYIINGKKVVVK